MKMPMYKVLVLGLAILASLSLQARSATSQPVPLSGSARPVIEQFLLRQAVGLPGKVGITINTPISGALPACESPEPFLPGGARLWGRLSVGVRCHSDQPWTRFVPVYIAVRSVYYVAARPILAGQALTLADATAREGDLTTLPRSVIVDPAQFNGATALNQIASGAPLRRELLRDTVAVQRGQTIRVRTQGTGFVVSAEGKAMTSAAVGALIQVKMLGGTLISGIVGPDGMVERTH
ncbi:flagellar basal body P-ring formation chaperone FlgA [Polaromonas sp.]|uniref:flagellar basal body P-ring formation chaperone FlgA n=2 Tax=Polaromonas sp. TaxID=1869339 RepID=UPI00273605F0|nr:flagellar basal body P-ring formation chaperone FlgA [Polaromonas sp.]